MTQEFALRYTPRRMDSDVPTTCTWMFTAALVTTAKKWKQPKCPLMDEWITRSITFVKEYYLTLKRKEERAFATTQMNLQNIVPNKRSQTQRPRVGWSHLYEMSRTGESIWTESRLAVARGGAGRTVATARGDRVSLGGDKTKMFWD